jgi:hypothetical protein
MEIIGSVCDSRGRLVVEHTLQFRGNGIALVTVKYERYSSLANMSM